MFDPSLLAALLDSWRRNNVILTHLLGALPDDALDLTAGPGSPTVGQLFTHIHYVRLVFVAEDVPERAAPVPDGEWSGERDRSRLTAMLNDSAAVVAAAVAERLHTGRPTDRHYDHPVLLLQHMIWHEGYHHGQIKLALKAAGRALDDDQVGPLTWGVWMAKGRWSANGPAHQG